MTYRIAGLDPDDFAHLMGADDAVLAAHGAVRRIADRQPGYPCRIALEDAAPGESLILLHHVSHDVTTPFRSAYAIYIRENARKAAQFEDEVPPVFLGRTLALRAFRADGMLDHAILAAPGEADAALRAIFGREDIAYIDVHNAAYGCFAARAERN